MLSTEVTETFLRRGYVELQNIFTYADVLNVQKASREILAARAGKYQHAEAFKIAFEQMTEHYIDPHKHSSTFAALPSRFDLPAIAQEVLDAKVVLWSSLLLCSPKGASHGQSWHQDLDATVEQRAACNLLFYPFGMNKDTDRIVVVPGSNRGNRLPAGEAFGPIKGQVELTIPTTSLLVLDCGTFHMVPRNQSSCMRLAVNYRYRKEGLGPSFLNRGVYRGGIYDFKQQKIVDQSGI